MYTIRLKLLSKKVTIVFAIGSTYQYLENNRSLIL